MNSGADIIRGVFFFLYKWMKLDIDTTEIKIKQAGREHRYFRVQKGSN